MPLLRHRPGAGLSTGLGLLVVCGSVRCPHSFGMSSSVDFRNSYLLNERVHRFVFCVERAM
jgi:hypothetical protein